MSFWSDPFGSISNSLADLDSSLQLSNTVNHLGDVISSEVNHVGNVMSNDALAQALTVAGVGALTGGFGLGSISNLFSSAPDALASIFGGAAPALGTEGTTAAMAGGFGDAATAGALSSPVIPAAATLTGELAPLASAAPAVTPLSEIGAATAPAASTITPATTSLSSIGTDAAAPGLTSAPAAAGLTAPVATDAATAGAGLTSGAGTTGLTAAANPSLAAGAPLAAASPVAAGMGGGTGLTALSNIGASAGAPLAAAGLSDAAGMGAPGLTTPTLNGGTVGETGVTAPITSGVNTVADTTTGTSVPSSLLQQLQTATGLSGTQLASLLQGGIGAVNSSNISNAIGAGVNAQAAANAQSQGVLKDVYNTNLGFQQPYQAAGTGAVNQLAAQQPYLTHQFDATDLQKGLAPNYDFMLQQGQMANQRAANVGGGALSGNTLQGLQNYTQNYAGNAYQNAFNNYQTQRNNIYNSLAGIANIGQTANTGATTAGQNYGTGTVGLNTGLAGVQAAGLLGQAQAGASGASGLGNSVLLSSLLGQNPSAATTTPASQLGNVAGVVNTGTNLYNQFSKLFGG